jgi:Spy/CpxP family protein refolding chaperone
MQKALAILLLPLALTVALMAQGAGGANALQNYVKSMTAQLGLSSEQQAQAATIFSDAAAAEAPLRTTMATARQSLENAVKSNDTGSLEQFCTAIGNLTAQLTLAQSKAKAAFYQILTPEQQAKLSQLESQRPGVFAAGPRR